MSRDVGVGQLVEELEQRGDRLPFEIGAFVALEACEGLLQESVRLEPDDVRVTLDGAVVVSESASAAEPDEAARSLISVLARLLVAAGPGVPPYLLQLVKETTTGHASRDLRDLHDAIEASLIPVNRSASRRVLARLVRESDRPPAPEVPEVDPRELDAELDELLRDPALRTLEPKLPEAPRQEPEDEEPVTERIRVPRAARTREPGGSDDAGAGSPTAARIGGDSGAGVATSAGADADAESTTETATAAARFRVPRSDVSEPITATIRKWFREEVGAETEAEPTTALEPVSEPEPAPASVPEPVSAPISASAPEPVPAAAQVRVSEPEAASAPEPESVPEPVAEASPEPESVPEAASAPEPESVPASEPARAIVSAVAGEPETPTEAVFSHGSVAAAESIPMVEPLPPRHAAPAAVPKARVSVPQTTPKARGGWGVWLLVAALGLGVYLLVATGAFNGIGQSTPTAPASVQGGVIEIVVDPADAQIFVYVGRGPAVAEDLGIGRAHEFVVFDQGLRPARAAVPEDAVWSTTEGGQLYELAMQPQRADSTVEAGDFGEPLTEASREGGTPAGSVRVVTNPPGAKVYRFVGIGPSATLAVPSIHEGQEVLIYHPMHETRRAVIGPSDWQQGDGGYQARLAVELPTLPASAAAQPAQN